MIKSSDGNKLAIVNPDAAGIDIADAEMQVCVPEDRDGDNNRRFGSFTCELNEIITWLKDCHITTVAMEATGIYYLSLFLRHVFYFACRFAPSRRAEAIARRTAANRLSSSVSSISAIAFRKTALARLRFCSPSS